jgi:mannose-1-phosphate guanylyltransferase/mannose-6-phosphate isomerase
MTNTYAIILSGGSGTRFWPLSRVTLPKQLLNICSDNPLAADTVLRILPIVKRENIYVATGKIHGKAVQKCLRRFKIPSSNFLLEPEGKNTLAPIAVLAERIYSRDPDAVIAVLPSDHFIRDLAAFRRLLKRGVAIARKGFIVTLGIIPDRPETGYGYIKARPQKPARYSPVEKFIEKPALDKAKKFCRDKRFFWNSGTFIFRADTVRREIKHYSPGVYRIVTGMRNGGRFDSLWRSLPFISFDYAVMEKTRKAVVLPAQYGWTDVGNWDALSQVMKPDRNANILKGRSLDLGSRSTIVWSEKRLVATVGLNNIIVVDTPDAVLVCSRDKAQDVKQVVQLLKEKKLRAHL